VTLRVHPDEIVARSTSALLAVHPSWERVRLDEIAVVQNGCAFPSSAFGPSGDMPLIRIRDVGKGTTATWYSGSFDAQYVVEPGSLIVGMDGDFRVEEWRGARALLNQRVCKVTVSQPGQYSHKFLRWTLPGYLEAVHRETSSVTVKHLSSETVKQLPLPMPPRAEQDRIVAAIEEQFSRLDAAVTVLEHAKRKLTRMRSAVLEAAVTGRLDGAAPAHTDDRSNGHSHLPPHWERVTVGEIAEISGGITKNPKRRPNRNPIPFLRVANVQRDALDLSDVHTVEVFDGELDRLRLQRGDLLVVEGNGSADQIGRSAIWDGSIDPCVHQNHLIRVRPGGQVLPKYLNLYWNAPSSMATIRAVASSTSGLYTLSTGKVRSIPVTVPPMEVQQTLVREVQRQLSLVAVLHEDLTARLRQSASLRASILSAAFSGRLAPQDADDEPASVLLERIAMHRALPSSKPPRTAYVSRKATA
jgi:type I restriction enzyme S subunit